MAIIDTTNVINSAIAQKAKLTKNLSKENYYLKTLQDKINYEWDYRYNVVNIEEEPEKQITYTQECPVYTPVEVVIQNIITDKGEKLTDDWKRIVFKDLKHPRFLGKRYRFSYDFEAFANMTEEEKQMESSVWIAGNYDSTSPTNSIVIRRCNGNLAFAGSPTRAYTDITEIHYEPCVLETELKYINTYFNKVLNVPQAEIYAIMQYNYFTQNILVNDRYLVGDGDLEVRENNTAFKVKAVNKFFADSTFKVNFNQSLADIPLVIIALDRDTLSVNDDFEHRLADRCTLYKVDSTYEQKKEGFKVRFEEPYERTILLGETSEYKVYAYDGETKVEDANLIITSSLEGATDEGAFYGIRFTDDNTFVVTNRKMYPRSKLKVECSWAEKEIIEYIEIELGGWY